MAVLQTFASEAQRKLDSGDAQSAAALLEDGLHAYPDYTTAYVVLARAYECLNDIESAFEVIQRGLKRFPSHRVLRELDAELRPKALETHPRIQTPSVASVIPAASVTPTPEIAEASDQHKVAGELLAGAGAVAAAAADAAASKKNLPEVLSLPPEAAQQPVQIVAVDEPSEPIAKPLSDDPDVLLDDGLSNVDDDNDNWPELLEIVEDDSRVDEIPANDTNVELDVDEQDGDSESDAAQESVDTKSVLKRINVVDGAVVVDQSLLKRLRQSANATNLRLLDTTSDKNSKRSLRSSNMRLVPGLEFTPLRVQSIRKQHVRTHYLPEAPSFPVIRGSEMNISPAIAAPPITKESSKRKKVEGDKKAKTEPKRTQLEELAARLERARIPVITEEPEPGLGRSLSSDTSEPMVISETMAGIYEQQGFYDQAIKAYRQLARIKPEKLEYFERKIAQLAKKPD